MSRAGLPIVCFDEAGGMPEFVQTDCGKFVPFEDISAAATAIVGLAQDAQLGAQGGDEPVHLGDDLFTLGATAGQLADDLRQRYQVDESSNPSRPLAQWAVGEFRYPVQHANRERLAATWTGPGVCIGLAGLEPDPAFAVPIQVVTPAFGMEVDGPGESRAGTQRLRHCEVVQPGAECGRLPADHRR